MLLNYNPQNQFNHYQNQTGHIWSDTPRFSFPQPEPVSPVVCPAKKPEPLEQDRCSNVYDEEPIEDGIDEYMSNENDHEYLYLTIDLPPQAINKLKNLTLDQISQVRQLGILGFQFENENTTFKMENLANNCNQSEDLQLKKRPRKTVMELTVNNCVSHDSEPKSKKAKLKESDADSSNCSDNMSDELKNIYQIRQMLSQQAQKEEEGMEKHETGDKPKKPRQRAPPDPNKPKAKRCSKAKNEQGHETQISQHVHAQPPVRINQLIQQNSYMNQASFATKNQQTHFNQHQYTNNQEQMKIRNILFYNSNQNGQDINQNLNNNNNNNTNGYIDNQQKAQNANFLVLNSNVNSNSDCNSNSNMTTNSDVSLASASYSLNGNQINFLNI